MFFSLLAGLAIAFSLQLLLTNLGVALGLSAVGLLVANAESAELEEPVDSDEDDQDKIDEAEDGEDESFSAPVTHLLGLGVTVSVAPVLFAASFLATEFSQFESLWRGAIFGTILWSVYLLIVTWLSSKTVSGIADVVLGGATAGIRKLFSAVGHISPFGSATDSAAGKATASRSNGELSEAERVSLIARELGTVMSSQGELSMLIAQRRDDLIREMSDRAQLSPQQAETVIHHLSDEVEPASSKVSAAGKAVAGKAFAGKAVAGKAVAGKAVGQAAALTSQPSVPHWRKLMRMGLNQLDITDWDLESAWRALQAAKGVQEALPFNIISLDVEDYLSEIPQWVLASDSLETDLIERLYDPEADPELVKRQLQSLKPEDFIQWLMQRGDLSDEAIQSLGGKLSNIYHSVLETVEAKTQVALAQSSKAASATRATFNDNGSAVKVLKQLGSTAEKAVSKVSEVAKTIDGQIAGDSPKQTTDKETTDKETTDGQTPAVSQSQIALKQTVDDTLKSRFSEVQDKLLSYFRYTTLDKLTAESVGEKLKAQLEDSDLLTVSGLLSLGDEPVPQAVKSWLTGWVKTSSEALETVISKRKGITKKHCAVLQKSLQAAWKAHYPPSLNVNGPVEAAAIEKKSIESVSVEAASAEDNSAKDNSVEKKSIESQDVQNNAQRNGFPRRWAKRVTQDSARSLVGELAAGDWQQQVFSQLVSMGDKGSEAVENAGGAMGNVVGGAVETVEAAVTDTLEAAQGQFSEAIASAQQKIESQVEAAKHELQAQAESMRHQAAIAAWWLFASLLTSELAAAGAGWLAVRYPV